jgi:signal transduction histidine kinase
MAQSRGLRLELRLAPGPVVFADPESLGRAVDNLLSNATRLAPAGSELTVAVGIRRGWAWVAVRDEGPGFSASDLERIFDRFVRGVAARAATASRAVMTLSNPIAPRATKPRRPFATWAPV